MTTAGPRLAGGKVFSKSSSGNFMFNKSLILTSR